MRRRENRPKNGARPWAQDNLSRALAVPDIHISKNMIIFLKKARAEYAFYLEKVKEEKVNETLKRKAGEQEGENILEKKAKGDLKEKISKLTISESELLEKQETLYFLLIEVAVKLENAVKSNDFQVIMVAQMMLSAPNTTIKQVSEELAAFKKDISSMQNQL